MAKSSKSKYYVVWVGQKPGIYRSWPECQAQVVGFPNAKYKSFKTLNEAEDAYNQKATDHIIRKSNSPKTNVHQYSKEIIADSISVDAACSGNPGIMEYRGVHTISKEQIFIKGPYNEGTNNVGEFLALVHGLAYLKKENNAHTVIYTDSKTAMAWVRNKKIKTTLKQTAQNKSLFELMDRALLWLHKNEYSTEILKWKTSTWGEIPADFGRK